MSVSFFDYPANRELPADKDCGICLTPLEEVRKEGRKIVAHTGQGGDQHPMCEKCIKTWAVVKNQCPSCRQTINKKSLGLAKKTKKSSGYRKWGIVAAIGAIAMVAIAMFSNPTAMQRPAMSKSRYFYAPYQDRLDRFEMVDGKYFDLRKTCIEIANTDMPPVHTPTGLRKISPINPDDVLYVGGYGSGEGIKHVSTWPWFSNKQVDLKCLMQLKEEAFNKLRIEDYAASFISPTFENFNNQGVDIEASMDFVP